MRRVLVVGRVWVIGGGEEVFYCGREYRVGCRRGERLIVCAVRGVAGYGEG